MKLCIHSRQAPLSPPEVESLRQRLERWRRNRRQRGPIPRELWAAAAELARRHGPAKMARALRLDYYSLKERIETVARPRSHKGHVQPAFVELVPPPVAVISECTMELEDPSGARMRIHLKGTHMPDLASISESFWRVGR